MSTAAQLAIFADAGLIKLIFVAVFFVIWIINNLIGEKAKARKAKPLVRPAAPLNPDAPPAERAPPQPQLVTEIEEFLKRANRKRQEKAKRKQPTKVAKSAPPPVQKPPRRLVPSQFEEPSALTPDAVVTVAESVRQHLDTSDFSARASQLADADIARDDAERAAHLKQVFDHQVGRLADTSAQQASPATKEPAAAASLAALLANPQSLKQAIVLQEILNRPEQRW